jgi:Nucleolar protein,Nop52
MDRFYFLATWFVVAGTRFLQTNVWDREVVDEYSEMLSHYPLQHHNPAFNCLSSTSSPKFPNAIRYHIADVYIDELDKVQPFGSCDDWFIGFVIWSLASPFTTIRMEGADKVEKVKQIRFWTTLAGIRRMKIVARQLVAGVL